MIQAQEARGTPMMTDVDGVARIANTTGGALRLTHRRGVAGGSSDILLRPAQDCPNYSADISPKSLISDDPVAFAEQHHRMVMVIGGPCHQKS